MWAIVAQTILAGTVAGVALAWIAYAVGVDRVLVVAIRALLRVVAFLFAHPLQSAELIIAVPMSWLPAPKVAAHRLRTVRA